MSAKADEAKRFERYELVVARVVAEPAFLLAQVKDACPAVTPMLVTRIVRQLERDGYLQSDGPKAHNRFRWTDKRSEFVPREWIESKVLTNRVTRAPLSDRPRERLLAEGAATLRTADLLAILIRSGRPGESALQAAERNRRPLLRPPREAPRRRRAAL